MSRRPIDRSPPLKKLRDEGYDVDVVDGYLLLRDIPYVNASREIKRGVLFAPLRLANDVALPPDDHQVKFAGDQPCHEDGRPIHGLGSSGVNMEVAGLRINWNFSAKPKPSDRYDDFHHKMSHYATMMYGPAQAIDPSVTPLTFHQYPPDQEDSIFLYEDTASSRADIVAINDKLRLGRVGIVGLGGTGSYTLDYVVKTPVKEIHLFDGDIFLQHNAFRAPGAASGEQLDQKLPKVSYYAGIYGKMRRGIVPHPRPMGPTTLNELEGLDFVFICMEGKGKKPIVEKLEELKIPFIDVGMGITIAQGSLRGQVRTTTSTPSRREHVRENQRISFITADDVNEYDKNIQVVELNALNAALAVIKWKKLFGFYADDDSELFSVFVISGNEIINEDKQ